MKKLLATAAALMALAASACWYRKANYNDYIATVNNGIRHVASLEVIEPGMHIQSIDYAVTNCIEVDFPVTVTMRITSEDPIILDDAFSNDGPQKRALVQACLEYRVLPYGDWVRVSEYAIETGRLPASYPPAPYLGRNNIFPKGLKKGDMIMVRLYVTDGQWQSGELESKCDEPCTHGQYAFRYEYPFYKYKVSNIVTDIVGESDLGGGWKPHYVVVLKYSGKNRPIQ